MTPKRISHYESLGWTFTTSEWQNHHNGDWETDYIVKSPRLDEGFDIGAPYDRVTEANLLSRERQRYIHQRLDEYGVEGMIMETVSKALCKNPDAKSVTVTIKLK